MFYSGPELDICGSEFLDYLVPGEDCIFVSKRCPLKMAEMYKNYELKILITKNLQLFLTKSAFNEANKTRTNLSCSSKCIHNSQNVHNFVEKIFLWARQSPCFAFNYSSYLIFKENNKMKNIIRLDTFIFSCKLCILVN